MSSEERQRPIEGRISDGERAQTAPVLVALAQDGLSITHSDGSEFAFWRFADLIPGGPILPSDSDVLLRHAGSPRVTLYLKGDDLAKELIALAPQISPRHERVRLLRASFAVAVLILGALGFLLFSRFSASQFLAGFIPYKAAYELGEQNVQLFTHIAPTCENEAGKAALQRVVTRLQSAAGGGHPFVLHVGRTKWANAFALSGRHIVLLSGLIEEAKSPEEVAGVLAHEMGHGLEKDPETQFVRQVGMQTLIQLFTGQSGGADAPITASALLLQLRYSREAEHRADEHAVEILRGARLSPKPVGDFFQRYAQKTGDLEDRLQYLSTHPTAAGRAKLFYEQPKYKTEPLLSEKEWADARAICD